MAIRKITICDRCGFEKEAAMWEDFVEVFVNIYPNVQYGKVKTSDEKKEFCSSCRYEFGELWSEFINKDKEKWKNIKKL